MKKIFCLILLVCSAQGFALLPPLYTSLNEFKALVASPELTKQLDSGETIVSLRRTKNGLVVITNKHVLFAEIQNLPTDKPGPAEFQLKFHAPIERTKHPRWSQDQ